MQGSNTKRPFPPTPFLCYNFPRNRMDMEENMTRLEQLLDKLDDTREALLVALERLPDEAFAEPDAIGSWSVQDLLANITAWEAELVTGLMRLKQGKKPDKLLAALDDVAAYDQARFAENFERPLETTFDDFQKVRMELETWLEEFSDLELTRPRQFKWFRRDTLAQIIERFTINRERPFAIKVAVFAEQWEAREAAANANIIPLTLVEAPDDNTD